MPMNESGIINKIYFSYVLSFRASFSKYNYIVDKGKETIQGKVNEVV